MKTLIENAPTTRQETTIPFSGFYESIHDHMIDREIESFFDHEGSGDPEIPEKMFDCLDYSKIHLSYSRFYLTAFEEWLESETGIKLGLEWGGLSSPREYNFTTDRIFATVPPGKAKEIFDYVEKNSPGSLSSEIKSTFTSRDGFISYYDSDINDWPSDHSEWDANQLGTMLEALAKAEGFEEHYVMEDCAGNGEVGEAIWDGMSEEGQALVNASYENREKNEKATA